LNGWKRPLYALALIVATVMAVRGRRMGTRVTLPGLPLLIAGGWVLLATAYVCSFPPSTWNLIPFFDDWPPRFQATVEGLQLLARGAVAGWQWNTLGGYHTSADLSQSLTMIGAVPMAVLGDRLGYHVLHALLVSAIPLLVYLDIAASAEQPRDRDEARLTLAFALVGSTGFFGTIMPSGDTNSIAGVLCVMLALIGSSFARRGRTWGGPVMGIGLILALYTHLGFFLYANIFLLIETIFYRDVRMLVRHTIAAATAVLAALPNYWELIWYPEFFKTNNIVYGSVEMHWPAFLRKLFYNTELLLHPHRWFNDYVTLVQVFLAVFAWVAFRGASGEHGERSERDRARFYAWAALAVVVMTRLDTVQLGYLFARQMHMMAVFLAPPLAAFIVRQSGQRTLAWALIAVVGLYVQSQFTPIRHVDNVRDFNPALIDHLGTLDGNLVLIEGNPHRDLISALDKRTERTPFGTHFESMLSGVTGRRFYGQTWDGWHWTPWRGQQVAAGSFRGKPIEETPVGDFEAEMRKWGVRHLVVWSRATVAYLDAVPNRFVKRWTSDRWIHYEMHDADIRAIVIGNDTANATATANGTANDIANGTTNNAGTGTLRSLDPLSGEIALTNVRRGDLVIARMNYFPAWTATAADTPAAVPLLSQDGQLAFRAPADGTYVVRLTYQRRTPLVLFSAGTMLCGIFLLAAIARKPASGGANDGESQATVGRIGA
jgi:hypothetical protein